MRNLIALLVLAVPVAAQANVWVVATTSGPGVDFTTLESAVNGAASGDVLLVRPGNYTTGFTIDGKELALVADIAEDSEPAANVAWTNVTVQVQNLSQNQRVVLRGFNTNDTALQLTNNAGTVVLENCGLTGVTGFAVGISGGPAVRVVDCSGGVIISRSTLTGGDGIVWTSSNSVGGTALEVVNSTVFMHGVTAQGGAGGIGQLPPFVFDAKRGGYGIDGANATVVLEGCSVQAGPTGVGGPNPVDGVPCVVGMATNLRLLDSTILGGAPSSVSAIMGPQYGAGVSVVTRAGSARSADVQTPKRAGELAPIHFVGEAGDMAFVFASNTLTPAVILAGGLPLGLGFQPIYTGISAVLTGAPQTISVTMPSIGGENARQVLTQTLFVQPSGLYLSGVSTVLVLDPSF